MHWKLRTDPRVEVHEGVNARHLRPGELGAPFPLAVADVSFISLTLILTPVLALLEPGATMIALVKPQFELSRQDVGRGGVVRDTALHAKAVEKIRAFVTETGLARFAGVIDSPIEGAAGNREFLVHLLKPETSGGAQ
jgi:23S rRNA (cytidine1920-2'-O)/16S rRNA (cytidine1409-2'-O)-methyltransferase